MHICLRTKIIIMRINSNIAKGAPEVELQSVVFQRLELLVVFIIADADDRAFGGLDRVDELRRAATIAARHSVYLIHDEANLYYVTARLCPQQRWVLAYSR